MEKKINILLVEVFMAKADWKRCFHGIIKREVDENDNTIVRGKIKVNDVFVYSQASNQDELGKNLDETIKIILDYDLNKFNKG